MRQKFNEDKLIAVSLDLFKARGYEDVSVMELCRACQITKPTFYKYVAGKDELLHLFYKGADKQMASRMAQLEKEEDWVGQVWFMMTMTMSRSMTLGRDIYSHYLIHCFKANRPVNKFAFALRDEVIAAIDKAQKAGQITNHSSPALLFRTLMNSTIGIACQWGFGSQDFNMLDRFHDQFNLVLRPV